MGFEYAVLLEYERKLETLVALRPIYARAGGNLAQVEAEAELETMRIRLDEPSTTARAFLTGQTSYLNHPSQSPDPSKSRLRIVNVQNALVMPLRIEGQFQGVISLINRTSGSIGQAEVEDLEVLEPALAGLLKTVQLGNVLEYQQRRQQAVMDAAVDGFVEVSRDMRITLFSKGAENMTGWKAEEALGHTCQEVLQPHSPEGESLCDSCPLRRSFRYGISVSNVETLIPTREGEDNWVSCSYNSFSDERGQVVSGIIALKDIYRLKALSDELRQQTQQQESLINVNNAINGLSNIEEIYRVSLDAMAKGINFDLATIHSLNEETGQLNLVTFLERKSKEAASPFSIVPVPAQQTSLGLTLEEEELQRLNRQRLRRVELPAAQLARENPAYQLQLHHSSECEALRQNEPYMSVNLPGKPACEVLHEFAGLQSHLCVPIKTGDHTYAVLHLGSRKPYAFWGSDFVLALSICKQIAVGAERAHLFEQVDRLARTDSLTGLYNKREMKERLEREIRRAERHQSPLSLLLIDLDCLKWVNDCFGHAQGDVLLVQLGQLIRDQCRASDVAFRFGGDELCILMPDTGHEEAKVAADRLRAEARKIRFTSESDPIIIGQLNEVTMSVGISCYPQDALTSAELFESADAAMYRAKETGKDRTVVFDRQIDLNRQNYRRNRVVTDFSDSRLRPPLKSGNATH